MIYLGEKVAFWGILAAACAVVLSAGGCTLFSTDLFGQNIHLRQQGYLQTIAAASGRELLVVETPLFPLQTLGAVTDPTKPLVVYIEGDGHVYEKGAVSRDPTPQENPIGLQLSAVDRSPNVVYIARPCQYVGNVHDSSYPAEKCLHADFWTTARYAPEVIQAVSIAVDIWKNRFPRETGIHIVGYSGGATISGILAATRKDVLSWRTVAGLVNQRAFLNSQGKAPYGRSLDLLPYTNILQNVPQTHFVGANDTIIPPWILKSFLDRYPRSSCSLITSIQAGHEEGWLSPWTRYWQVLPACS